MNRFLLSLVIAVLSVAFILTAGCSDNDNGTDASLVTGDTTDPGYQFVREFTGPNSSTIGVGLDMSFGLLDSIPGASPTALGKSPIGQAKSLDDSSVIHSLNYVYENGWHIFSFEATYIEGSDSADFSGIDSLRTLKDGVPQQFPDSTMNGLLIRHHFSLVGAGTGASVDASSDQSLDIDATSFVNTGFGVVNGSSTESLDLILEDSAAVCSLSLAQTLDIDDIIMYIAEDDGCVTGGSIDVTASIDLSCEGEQEEGPASLNISGGWTANFLFENDSVTVTYSDGTTQWVATETNDCGPSVSPFTVPF